MSSSGWTPGGTWAEGLERLDVRGQARCSHTRWAGVGGLGFFSCQRCQWRMWQPHVQGADTEGGRQQGEGGQRGARGGPVALSLRARCSVEHGEGAPQGWAGSCSQCPGREAGPEGHLGPRSGRRQGGWALWTHQELLDGSHSIPGPRGWHWPLWRRACPSGCGGAPWALGSAGPPSGLPGPVPRALIKRSASGGQEPRAPFGPVPCRPGLALSDVTVTAHPWAVASSRA